MANWSPIVGPSGSGSRDDPIVLNAADTRGSWPMNRAKKSHHQLASWSALPNSTKSIPPSMPMMA